MTRAAQSVERITPTGTVPDSVAPFPAEFTVRIFSGASENNTLDRDPGGQWVGRLRRISAAKLRDWGLTPIVDDARLLISELVTNALRYGQGAEISLSLAITPHGLLISVADGSPRRPQLSVADNSSETGRGLSIVAALADTWGVSPDGTTTWCTLSASKER